MDKSPSGLREWARSHIDWFGQSAFRLRTDDGPAVFFDPFRVPPGAGPAGLILVTHPHPDHYDRRAVEGLRGKDTIVVLPQNSAAPGTVGMAAGDTRTLGSIRVTAVAAYNVSRRFHPRGEGWIGYVVEAAGVRIYHAGDTDLIPEMEGLAPDIALLPIGGLMTMNVAAAVEAAARCRAAVCIPMHYGMLIGGRRAGSRFVEQVGERGLELARTSRARAG